MSTQPRLEARVSAQERRLASLDARIEELSEDTTTNFKQLSESIETSFKLVSEYFGRIEAKIATKEDITEIKATMATKEDITEIKATMATINQNTLTLLTQILERLPKNEK